MISKIINETTNFAKQIFQTDFTHDLNIENTVYYQLNCLNYSAKKQFEMYITFYCKNSNNEVLATEEYHFQNETMSEINKTLESVNQKKYAEFIKKINLENEL